MERIRPNPTASARPSRPARRALFPPEASEVWAIRFDHTANEAGMGIIIARPEGGPGGAASRDRASIAKNSPTVKNRHICPHAQSVDEFMRRFISRRLKGNMRR
jgi:hypothetical protein